MLLRACEHAHGERNTVRWIEWGEKNGEERKSNCWKSILMGQPCEWKWNKTWADGGQWSCRHTPKCMCKCFHCSQGTHWVDYKVSVTDTGESLTQYILTSIFLPKKGWWRSALCRNIMLNPTHFIQRDLIHYFWEKIIASHLLTMDLVYSICKICDEQIKRQWLDLGIVLCCWWTRKIHVENTSQKKWTTSSRIKHTR